MTFLIVITAFAIVQYWGSASGFHRDGWWQALARAVKKVSSKAEIQLLLNVFLPVLVLWLLLLLVYRTSVGLYFVLCVPLLLYSLGRNELVDAVRAYTEAYHRNDNVAAVMAAKTLGVAVEEDCTEWGAIHAQVLQTAAYRGFERMFVNIFWFVCLGPAGAVLYRLTTFNRASKDSSEALCKLSQRLLWLLEWPAVRVMGLSFALTGNFVGCFQRWRDHFFCLKRPTDVILVSFVHGALSVRGVELNDENITEQEIEALLPLLSRTLVFLLCALAIWSIL